MSNALASVSAWVHVVFAALHAPVTAYTANVGAIIANRPEPARTMVFDTLVSLALAWAALKIAAWKKAK